MGRWVGQGSCSQRKKGLFLDQDVFLGGGGGWNVISAAIISGSKSRFGIMDFSISDTILGLWFSL